MEVAEEVLQPSETMKQEMNIPSTDNFHIPVGDNADISTEKYNQLLKNQEKIIAMMEAGSSQQHPPISNENEIVKRKNVKKQTQSNGQNPIDYTIYIRNAKSVNCILSNR